MRRTAGFQTPRWIGWTLLGAAVLVTTLVLCGSQIPLAFAADEPAAAGSAQPAGSGQAAGTQGTPSSKAKASKKTKGEKSAKPRGRLPNHFAGVVSDEQRDKIYAIQREFEPKIRELTLQLDSLKKQRDEKIQAVLTPEQKKKIDDLKAAAKDSRAKKKEGT